MPYRLIRICLSFLLAGVVLTGESRPEIPTKLTLSQAVEIAFRSSTALVRAAAQTAQAQGLAEQSRSQLMPQFNISAADTGQTVNLKTFGINFPGLPGKVGPFQTVDARAGVTQNVFNLQTIERDRAAREQVHVNQSLALNTRETLALQVAVAYSQAYRAQAAVRTLAEQAELARKLHQITMDRTSLGVSSKLDSTRSEIQVRNLEQSLLESENTLVSAKLQLANIVHAQPSSSFELTEPAPATGIDSAPEKALQVAIENRPDYKAALVNIRAAELRVSAARAERYPTVQFKANFGQSGTAWNKNIDTFQVQGSVNIPVYTGGRIHGEIAEAQGHLDEAKAQAEETRSQIETDVLSALAAYDSAKKQLEIARIGVGLSRNELELSTDRFTNGVADNTEIVNAQDRLTRAEDSAVRAAYQLDLAQAQLYRATGAAEKFYRKQGAQQ